MLRADGDLDLVDPLAPPLTPGDPGKRGKPIVDLDEDDVAGRLEAGGQAPLVVEGFDRRDPVEAVVGVRGRDQLDDGGDVAPGFRLAGDEAGDRRRPRE